MALPIARTKQKPIDDEFDEIKLDLEKKPKSIPTRIEISQLVHEKSGIDFLIQQIKGIDYTKKKDHVGQLGEILHVYKTWAKSLNPYLSFSKFTAQCFKMAKNETFINNYLAEKYSKLNNDDFDFDFLTPNPNRKKTPPLISTKRKSDELDDWFNDDYEYENQKNDIEDEFFNIDDEDEMKMKEENIEMKPKKMLKQLEEELDFGFSDSDDNQIENKEKKDSKKEEEEQDYGYSYLNDMEEI